MITKLKLTLPVVIFTTVLTIMVQLSGCGDSGNLINDLVSNELTAKQRIESAMTQASAKYGPSTKLVLVFGKNVKTNGRTDISALTIAANPDSVGAWVYVFRAPTDTSLKVFTPNPVPTASDCIELTAFFNTNTLLNLIQDTSARNIISGALALLTTSNVNITTSTTNLTDSDVSLNLANSTNPIIKFNSSYIPDTSSLNGNTFFTTGTNKTINMFLIPAAGTLNLPELIKSLTNFPPDLWVVNYKKINSSNQSENLILGTVVESSQLMGDTLIGITSKVINISKYVSE
jgi:hypothetical protein